MQLTNLFKSSMVYAFGNILTRAVGFLLLPFYTRYLSSGEYGTIELIELVISVTSLIFGLGIFGGAMIRTYHEFQDQAGKNSVISSSIISAFFASTIVSVVGIALAPFISRMVFKSADYSNLLILSFLALIISNIVELCLIYLRIIDRPKVFVLISCAQFVFMASLNIVFIGFMHAGVWGFVYSKLICLSLVAVFLLVTVLRETGLNFSAPIIKRVLQFGVPLIGSGVAFFIIHFSDRFMLQYYRGVSEVGVYSVAYKFGFLITFLVGEPFGKVWNVRMFAHTNDEFWKENFANVFAYFILALLLVWSGIAYFHSEITHLMVSKDFNGAALLIPLIALAYVFREIGDFFRQIIFINKSSGLVSKIAIFCALFNTVMNLVLIKPYGSTGAMWATLLTWFVYAAILYFYSQKEFQLKYRPAILVYFVLSISLYVVILVASLDSLWMSAGLHAAIFISFVSVLIWGNYLTQDEKERLSLRFVQPAKRWLCSAAER